MREMKDSGIEWIGDVPKDWNVERLQWHLYEINEKNNPVKTTFVLSLTNKQGVIPYGEKGNQGNKSKLDYSGYKLAYPDTIVANSMNILIGSVGYSNYYGCVSPVYYVFKEARGENLKFINYIFQTEQFQRELRRYANGILEIRLRVSATDILKRMVAFPHSEEQSRIVAFLDKKCEEIDAVSKDLQSQIDTLMEYKKSVINETVTKGLGQGQYVSSGIQWVDEIPSHWKLSRFKYVATVKSNLVAPKGYEDYPQISPDNIEKNSGRLLSYNSVEEAGVISGNHLFFEGQILYSKIRPNLNKVVIAPFSGLCSADMYPIETRLYTKFMLYLMLSPYFVDQVSLVIQDRVKMPKINQDELCQISVVIPPEKEQIEIANYLDEKCSDIDLAIDEKQRQLSVIDEYRKSLIFEYVTGKKEVPV